MARFTLVLTPNGKALMVTSERIPPAEMATLRDVWDAWEKGDHDVLFVSDTEVRLVEDIELDLEEAMARKSDNDLVDKQGNIDLSIDKEDVDEASDAAEPAETDDAPKSITGDASPEKRG